MKIRFCNLEKFVGTGGQSFTKKYVFSVNFDHRHTTGHTYFIQNQTYFQDFYRVVSYASTQSRELRPLVTTTRPPEESPLAGHDVMSTFPDPVHNK